MSATLFLSLAGNIAAVLLVLWLLVSRSVARTDRDTAQERVVDLKDEIREHEETIAAYRSINGQMLTELTEYRAKAEKVRQGALKATQASAAARAAKAGKSQPNGRRAAH